MHEISEQYFRKDCGAAARNIFPNEIIPIQNYPQSQTNSAALRVAAESARVQTLVSHRGTVAELRESAAHLQSTCSDCRDGEDAHGSICRSCGRERFTTA